MAAIKSYHGNAGPLIQYITQLSTKLDPIQEELQKETIAKDGMYRMLGAPEVLELGKNMLHLIQAKKALDIGTFTGASALAWALALPEGGRIVSMDVSHESLDSIGRPVLQKRPDLLKKIEFRLGSAIDTLDALIASGETGTFDFAFIDADKDNYTNYYEKSLQLLRPGGVILVDNALWNGSVVEPKDASSRAIDSMNRHASADSRTLNSLLNIGDGVHLIIKKH